LPSAANQEILNSAFVPFGDIKNITFANQPSAQFALVEFEDGEDCEHAIFNMSESEFFGKVI